MAAATPSSDVPPADDALLGVTRGMAFVILPVLVAAFVILFAFPARTGTLWSWTIDPPVTAVVMGAGYLAGAWYFLQVVRARRWHTIGAGFWPITGFTSLLLLATILHWEAFDHDHVSFWAWLGLYVATPPLLPLVWWRNRLRDPGTATTDGTVDLPMRRVVAAVGAGLVALVVVVTVRPDLAAEVWPWPLSALTARVVAAFATFPALTLVTFGWEDRWSALRHLVDAAAIGLALSAVGVAIHVGDLTAGPLGRVLYLVVLLGSAGLLVTLRLRVRSSRASPATGS